MTDADREVDRITETARRLGLDYQLGDPVEPDDFTGFTGRDVDGKLVIDFWLRGTIIAEGVDGEIAIRFMELFADRKPKN